MKNMSTGEILTIAFMMFSIFFGAGNLIFPPALGQAAGTNTPMAMLGFIVTGVGLPLMGILAVGTKAEKYGDYIQFVNHKMHYWMAFILLGILYLTIGPLFAIPRMGAVSFEIGIRPFLGADQYTIGQAIYSFIFFALTYYLALTPSKLIDRVGKMLTPLLLLALIIFFIKVFLTPLGDIMPPIGNYIETPFSQGFQDGYQTMDLLASLSIGTIVINAIRMRGTTEESDIRKVCILSGLITVVLMTMVYGSLAYLGATSAQPLGHSENGGQLLADAVNILFGSAGNLLVAIIITLACLTTSCGIISGTAWYFNRVCKNKVSYERLVLFFAIFSMVVMNVGLTQIITLSLPFLVAIYPMIIVFVILSFFDDKIGKHLGTYRLALDITLFFALVDGFGIAGIKSDALNAFLNAYVPFYSLGLGWLIPAIIAAIVGYFVPARWEKE